MYRMVLALMLLVAEGRANAGAPAVLGDARLAPAAPQLAEVWAAAARDGVPESILNDKLNEGLAKGVPAARIALVIRTLESSLAEAQKQLAGHVSSPPPALLKAMVEARNAGADKRDLETLLAAGAPRGAQALTRALDVLTDLAQRGFPVAAAVRAVSAVVAQNPRGLDQITARAQALTRNGVTRAEALDAIARGPQDHAAEAPGQGKAPPGLDNDRGPNRESSSQRGPGFQHGRGKP